MHQVMQGCLSSKTSIVVVGSIIYQQQQQAENMVGKNSSRQQQQQAPELLGRNCTWQQQQVTLMGYSTRKYNQLVQNQCKVCCLSGIFHVKNTLHVCITLQQHCNNNLLYKQSHTAKVLGNTVVLLGFRYRSFDKTLFGKYKPID